MSIYVIGLNHKTASITLREKVYFATEKLALYLQDILSRGYVEEAVLLSTCNRSELYCSTEEIEAARDWFCAQTSLPRTEIESAIYVYRDEAAISHMMEVACGLDSMILGEPQILGQMKEAFSESCTVNAVGSLFHRLFQQVFSVAKEIRTVTAIGACPVSVASAAVHFAKHQLPHFTNANVVLIGAGETTEIIMRYLNAHLAKPITLVNRSIEKAEKLIDEWGGNVHGLDKINDVLLDADIVFSATASVIPIVTKEMVAEVMQSRHGKTLLMIDMAVPRDIDPSVSELEDVHLYCVDDLKNIIEANRLGREHAAEKAREMIAKKCKEFFVEMNSIDHVSHAIREYRGQIEQLCRIELKRAKERLQQGADADQVLDAFAYAFTNKLLHTPSVQLRQAGAEGRFELLRFARELFALPDPETKIS
ncbi:MAG: hypothetical protein ACD_46C00100G0002 [uncultured bacterium]|nr:MAG: hypothetical protein ACD_46C00100G0002 [uncultured bacterium]